MLFKDYKANRDQVFEANKEREAIMAETMSTLMKSDTYTIKINDDDSILWSIGKEDPEYRIIQSAIKNRLNRAKQAAGIKESQEDDVLLFSDHIAKKNGGIVYLNEEENSAVNDNVRLFETECDGKLENIDEGFLGKLIGGTAGFLVGPSIGRIIAKALGIEKGILYDMFNSRLVGAALGAAISKAIGKK